MILEKRPLCSNKLFNKHYKKLNEVFFSKKNVILSPVANSKDQLIHISVLTIDTISHKNFPNIIEVPLLSNSKELKKATLLFQGKTKISKKFVYLLNTFLRFSSKTLPKPECQDNKNSLFISEVSKGKADKQGSNKNQSNFQAIDTMQGAGVDMYHYKARLSKTFGRTKNPKIAKIIKDQTLLSKIELSSAIAQIISKSSKAGRQPHFHANILSNIVGALIVINSTMYYISDSELKQCGLVCHFKHSPMTNLSKDSVTTQLFLLRKLLNIDKIEDKKNLIFVGTQTLKPNTVFFNFLKIFICAGIFHDYKKILSQLLKILVQNSIVKK